MIQLQVLNKILDSADASIITLNNLNEEFFSDYLDEFYFIKNHLNIYGNIPDQTTFLNKFNNFELIKVNESDEYLLNELVKDRNKRFLAEKFNQIRNDILKGDIESAYQVVREAAEQTNNTTVLKYTNILEDTSRYDIYLEKTKNPTSHFINTGFKELDDIIGGWDVSEELGTIVARTGQGKSWLLLKSALAAAQQGVRVGIYSGEMSANKVGYRIDTLYGHIANGSLIHGNASIKNEYKKHIENLKNTIKGDIFVLRPDAQGAATVSKLRAFIEKAKLDILFVDQHSLLEDERKAKNPVEKAANISKDLKLLQVTKQIPIICVSQQNRTSVEGDGKTFDTTQVAQSDRIAQDATIMIFIERKDDLFKLHLVKSRDTENGKVLTYKVDLNTGNFTYIPATDNSDSTVCDSDGVEYVEDDVF